MAKMPPLTIRMKPELLEHLKKLAEEEERSISWVVGRIVEVSIKDYAGGLPEKS